MPKGAGSCQCDCCDHTPDVTAFLEKFENGTFTISPPEWFGPLMVGCFKQTLDEHDAPNYLEMRIGDKEGNVYPLILCRPNRPSPHQLRQDAEGLLDEANRRNSQLVNDIAALQARLREGWVVRRLEEIMRGTYGHPHPHNDPAQPDEAGSANGRTGGPS